MGTWGKRAAVATAVPAAFIIVACAGGQSIKESALGTWNCTVSSGMKSVSATVTVGDGTYQVSQSGEEESSGTWGLNGGRLQVKGDDGPYTAQGVPEELEESMSLQFGEGDEAELSPWSVSWKDDTVTFPYHGLNVNCHK